MSVVTVETVCNRKREQIIEGAASVFNQAGYDGASMSRIAEEAGVSKGTLYNYFESKSELFAAFVERETSDRLAWVFQSSEAEPSVAAYLTGVARRLIRAFLSDPFQTLHRIIISEAPKFPDLARIYYASGHDRGCREFAAWLALQSHVGRLRIPDPILAAEQFGALCKTRLWMERCLDLGDPASAADIDAVAEASVAMFLNTYGAPDGGPGEP